MMVARDDNLSAFERNRVYMNVRGGEFIDGSFASMADIDSDSRTVVPADIDGDGALDLIVGSAGGGPVRVFRNQFEQGNRVALRFVGTKSNRAGVGAKVVAEVGGQKLHRSVFPISGFMCIGPNGLWLGVGDAEKIDRLTIQWPSGTEQVFSDVAVNQRIEINEESDELKLLGVLGAKN